MVSRARDSSSIGIGAAAVLDALTNYVLHRAAQWELEDAMRWLTGSLNGSSWSDAVPALIALGVAGPVLVLCARDLGMLRLGDDTATALGVRTEAVRIVLIVAAVALIAFSTSAAGPIAFVAFLSGPIAARIVGPHGSLLIPAALVGALLVVVADLIGQFAFGTRYPVGVVTGALGAPYPRLPHHPFEPHRRSLLTLTERSHTATRVWLSATAIGTSSPTSDLGGASRGHITAIVGANACGKSTLLRSLSRLLAPTAGQRACSTGASVHSHARQDSSPACSGLLPQSPIAPDGITVADLVGRGRHPHQRHAVRAWSRGGRRRRRLCPRGHRDASISLTAPVDELSGGQRQRVWIAMVLGTGHRPAAARRAHHLPRTSATRSRCSTCSRTSTATGARRS